VSQLGPLLLLLLLMGLLFVFGREPAEPLRLHMCTIRRSRKQIKVRHYAVSSVDNGF
jgi:hypothetical protein